MGHFSVEIIVPTGSLLSGNQQILGFIAASWKEDRVASWLFAPYAVWVAFATLLNAAILGLN